MQFIRSIVQGNKLANVIDIPPELWNKKVEVLILPIVDKKSSPRRKKNSIPVSSKEF